jgi:cytochrome P450
MAELNYSSSRYTENIQRIHIKMQAEELDLTYAAEMGDAIFPILDELRERDPIHWHEKSQCWVVTRHDDILDALSGNLPLSNVRQAAGAYSVIPPQEWPERLPNLVQYAPHHITNIDPPEHTRLRKLLMKAFGKVVVEGMRPFANGIVEELMADLHRKPEVEFTNDVALRLPGKVILKLSGLPDELYDKMREWAHDVMVGLGTPKPQPEWVVGANNAFAEMTEHFLVQIRARRENPLGSTDFISALITARDGDDALTDEEIVATLQVVLVAGHDTTVNSMTLGVAALADHPDAWQYMREHPENIMNSTLELMRYSSMSTSQNRRVSQDFEWRGKHLKENDIVYLMYGTGNRDPRVFPDPTRLDLTRGTDRLLTFAPGLHHCIGHLLAKMQLTEFFGRLVQEFDGVEVLDDKVPFTPIITFRSVPSLHVRFKPRS